MKNKKLAILAAVCLVTASAAVATGCKPASGTPVTPPVTYEITLAPTLEMTVNEAKYLALEYSGGEAPLQYSSSNPAVATVDDLGFVTALTAGETTITVTYGDTTATCMLTVTFGAIPPALQLDENISEEMNIDLDTLLPLNAQVVFNNEVQADAEITYVLSDPTVGSVVDGYFRPAKNGSTNLTITGVWRNADYPTLTKTIAINVIPQAYWTLNEGVNGIELYTIAEEGLLTESDFVVTTAYNGVTYSSSNGEVTLQIVKGSDSVKLEDNKVKGLGLSGEATIKASVTIDDVLIEKLYTVNVKPTIYTYAETVENFSAIHGDVAIGASLKDILEGKDLDSAYTEYGVALTVRANKVYGVDAGIDAAKTGEFTRTITVCSREKGYTMTVKGYSGIFAKAQDFAVFNTNARKVSGSAPLAIEASKGLQVWDGYYVLANNIDASQYTHADNGEALNTWGIWQDAYNCGLIGGTFDGRGYTVKGMTIGAYGLFGYVMNATIKDVAFTETKLANVDYSTVLAQWIHTSTVSNVYIGIANTEYTVAGSYFAGGLCKATITACVIDASAITSEKDTGYDGSFFYQNRELLDALTKDLAVEDPANATNLDAAINALQYTEVYVISTTELGCTGSKHAHFIGENETAGTAEGENYIALKGVKRYDNADAMTDATFAQFNEFWDTSSGKPVWKTANDEFAPPVEDETSTDHVVGDFNNDWLN